MSIGAVAMSTCTMLAASAPAWAHVVMIPQEVVAGDYERLSVSVPTEKEVPTTGVRVEATVAATGIYVTPIHIPSLSALVDGPYGRALIMKLGLLVFLLVVGGINLIDKGREPFVGRMVGAELLLAIGVFVAAGLLTSVPPPDP